MVNEKNGTWGKVTVVTGTTASARNAAGSVSCGSANYCAAGGSYAPRIESPYQAFVVREKNGSWGNAIEVPGLAALNVGGSADVESVSCGQARYCAAGGTYRDGSGHQQAFVVSDKNGAWSTAIEVPGSAALNTGGSAQITSVSCASARYCVAAGNYTASSRQRWSLRRQPDLNHRTMLGAAARPLRGRAQVHGAQADAHSRVPG